MGKNGIFLSDKSWWYLSSRGKQELFPRCAWAFGNQMITGGMKVLLGKRGGCQKLVWFGGSVRDNDPPSNHP